MKVAILGAGFAGLGCALKLSKEHEVVLIEKQSNLGGVVASVDYNGAKIPWGSHWILSTDKTLVDIIKELGLEKDLKWKSMKMGFYFKGDIYGIANPVDLLRYRPLPFFDRIRFGIFGLRVLISKGSWANRLEGKSARKWLLEDAGKSICDNLFEPLSKIKFNQSLEEVSASWLYNRLVDTTKGGEKYGFVKGGFETIINALGKRIEENGGKIKLNANVNKIELDDRKVKAIEFSHNGKMERIEVDAIVSAMPTPALPKIVEFPKDFAAQLANIKYKYIINAFFVLDKKMVLDFDWINFCYDDLPFGGTLEHDLRVYSEENGSLLYVFTYLNEKDSMWDKNEEEIKTLYLKSLEGLFPGVSKLIKYSKVTKSNLAWPIYDKNYGKYMPSNETPIQGLYLAGIYTTYPKMPSTGVAAESGYRAAELTEEYLRGKK